jgi:TPR repeat protein
MALIPALLLSAAALTGDTEVPTPTVAAGIAAYNRADFARALAILKPIVYDVPADRLAPWSDPWATAYLAQMFRRGEGTQADWPCRVHCSPMYGVTRVKTGQPGSVRSRSWKTASMKSV